MTGIEKELDRLSHYPAFKEGYTTIFGKPFKFNHGPSFTDTYREIFQTIYQFKPTTGARTILDCGANIGLSVVYFSQNYPDHQIIAFEPDPVIFSILQENVQTLGLNNVTLHNKAVWDKEETLTFFTDKAMGGRVENSYSGQKPQLIETVRLKDFISPDVDFLKIDIEGSGEQTSR